MSHFYQWRYDDTIDWAKRALDIDPRHPHAREFPGPSRCLRPLAAARPPVHGIMRLMVSGVAVGLVMAAALARGPGGEAEARVSLDVKDAPVANVVRVLVEAGGFQVVFDPGIDCRLTMKLHEARWPRALAAALSACGLGGELEGDILRVATLSRLREEAVAQRRLEEERRARPSGRLALFRLSHARAQEMAPLLERILSPAGRVSYDARTNTLLVVY